MLACSSRRWEPPSSLTLIREKVRFKFRNSRPINSSASSRQPGSLRPKIGLGNGALVPKIGLGLAGIANCRTDLLEYLESFPQMMESSDWGGVCVPGALWFFGGAWGGQWRRGFFGGWGENGSVRVQSARHRFLGAHAAWHLTWFNDSFSR